MTEKTPGLNSSAVQTAARSTFFSSIDWPKFLSRVCYALTSGVLFLLFVENFVFSSGYEFLV